MRFALFISMLMIGITSHSKAQGIVDVHSHSIFPEYAQMLERHGGLLEEGFPVPTWDVEAHLRLMAEAGIACSVLTMPAPQPYYGDSEESRRVIRRCNERAAALKAGYPDRFRFCASLPLPDVEAAIQEAIYALDTLGADGIKLATNSRGVYLGEAALEPLMAVLNERKAILILHPHKPDPTNEELFKTIPPPMYEYMAETTRAMVNLIFHNVPARYPDLRFIVPHGGSFLPIAIPRMQGVHAILQRNGNGEPIDWEANLRNIYYDLAGNITPAVLRMLLSITTPDHLLYGSDYPYVSADGVKETLRALHGVWADDPEWETRAEDMLRNNAIQLFSH